MSRLKVFIYLTLFILANKAIAQVDSVTFRYTYDVATFRAICQAQKVNIVGTDTTITDFVIADTTNGACQVQTFNFMHKELIQLICLYMKMPQGEQLQIVKI